MANLLAWLMLLAALVFMCGFAMVAFDAWVNSRTSR